MRKFVEEIVLEQLKRSEMGRKAVEEQQGAPLAAKRPRVITISRQRGSGGTEVAKALAERLNWSLWGRELVDAIAEQADLQSKVVEEFDEKTVSEIEILARTLFGDREIGGFIYGRELARALLAIARRGNAVILGRAANFLIRDALNIRLEASEEARIQFMMSTEGFERDQAISELRNSDRERNAFARSIFDKDLENHKYYDIVIQMDCFSADDAADIVFAAAKTQFLELREGEESGKHMSGVERHTECG